MKGSLLILLLCPLYLFAQDDLDDIFDDGEKKSRFKIGIETLPLITTVPNVNLSIEIADDLTIRPGIGIIPFGFYYDLNNWRPGENLPILDRDVSVGLYYDFLAKYNLHSELMGPDAKVFVYANYQHWTYDYQSNFTVNRFKVNGGVGNDIRMGNRISAEIRYGFMVGRDRFTYHAGETNLTGDKIFERNYSFGYNQADEKTKFLMFLDIAFGLHYTL